MRAHSDHTMKIDFAFIALLIMGLFSATTLLADEAKPVRVVLLGVEGPLHATLLNDISLTHVADDRYPSQTDFLFRRAEQELLNALKAHGYYQASAEMTLQRLANETLASITVVTGDPVNIRTLDIHILGAGANELAWRQYRQFDIPLHVGQRLVHADYEKTLSDLINIAINHGYLDANFTQRSFRVNPHTRTADIHIELDTSDGYRFGEVSFSDDTVMDRQFLASFLEFQPGDHFSNQSLSELQQVLIGSRYFSLVRYEPYFDRQQDKHIPVHIHLEDNLPHRYRVGAGVGSDTGARLLFGFENRRLNSAGHRYEIDSIIGQRAQSALFTYSLPGKRPARQKWNLRAGWEASQSDYLERRRTTIMPEYSHMTRSDWLFTPYISMEQEYYRYQDQSQQSSRLLLAGVGLQQRVVNQSVYPSKGYRHNMALRLSQKAILSDSQFAQLEVSSKGIVSPQDSWRLIARARLATTWSDDLDDLPASYRYLLGGETLRGFAFESIGLSSVDGQIVGARHMALASLETDYRATRWLGLAAFTDVGYLYEPGIDTEVKIGSGIGLRGFTPVGTVRLDMAWAISEDQRPLRIHLSLGLDL